MTNNDRHEELKRAFVERRGYWTSAWDALIEHDADYFAAYLQLSSPGPASVLDAKTRELICIAIDIATTHLYRPGTRIHMRRAIELGATSAEIVEVLEIASLIGVHAVTEGVLLLNAELDRITPERGETPETGETPESNSP